VERHVASVAPGVFVFDEALDNDMLGRCRSSGVLVMEREALKLAQYNLSVPIPNDNVLDVVRSIKRHSGSVR